MNESVSAAALRSKMSVVMCSAILEKEEPRVIASVLADIMGMFLSSHIVRDNRAATERVRETLLTQWCDTVRELVAIHDDTSCKMQ